MMEIKYEKAKARENVFKSENEENEICWARNKIKITAMRKSEIFSLKQAYFFFKIRFKIM